MPSTAFLRVAQHKRESTQKKPSSKLVVLLAKAQDSAHLYEVLMWWDRAVYPKR